MLTVPFRVSDDIPPVLRTLLDLFYSDAILIRGVSDETIGNEIRYIIRFFRYLKHPDSCDEWFNLISPGSIARFLAKYHSET